MQKKNQPTPTENIHFPRNTSEHLRNLFKAALSTVPFAGGIASLMTDYIPSMKQKRLEEFVQTIAADLETLQNRINEETFSTEEFAFIFEKCFRGVAENYQVEKLNAFRGILINAAIDSDIEVDEREYYLNLVERLSALHLRLLAFMADPRLYLQTRQISEEKIRGGFSNFMPIAIPSASIDSIKGAFGDLHQIGFLNTDKSIFHTMTAGQGLDLLGDRLTEAGRSFVEFCTAPH